MAAVGESGAVGRLRATWEQLENPVMGREFRSRMRGARSYLITGGYTVLVSAIVLIVYWALTVGGPTQLTQMNQRAAEVGRGIWLWGCVVQACLLPLMVPAFTCGAITLEREREMLELLLLTRQSALQICLGKLASGVGLGLILIAASVPVLSISLILGGVAPHEILACISVLAASVVVSGALGLVMSSLAPRTVVATALTYLVVGSGMLGMPFLLAVLGAANSASMNGSELGILAMLLALILASFAPGVAVGIGILTLQARRTGKSPERYQVIGTVGASWALLLGTLYLPGMSELLMHGSALLFLHPVMTIHGLMEPGSAFRSWAPMEWLVCTVVYLGAAVGFTYLAILRVHRMRAA
ncbi:MAG: hypothetical protein ACK47B_19010 [Armatimonadota bacterium]